MLNLKCKVMADNSSSLYMGRNKHLRTLYIIGNGFDLELGYPTGYSDFIKSEEWEELTRKNPSSELLQFIESNKTENWFDLEKALFKFASNSVYSSVAEAERAVYKEICHSLITYLIRIVKERQEYIHKLKENNIGNLFLSNLNIGQYCRCYSFNYTCFKYFYACVTNKCFLDDLPRPINQHGYCGDLTGADKYEYDSIVLGIADKYAKQIDHKFEYMLKSNNPQYHTTNLLSDLAIAENIVIFGHSLNDMDSAYFEDFFSSLNKELQKKRRIIIITKNDKSAESIKHNMRNMGLDLQKLYSSVELEFFKTDELKNNKTKSREFVELLNKL